MCDNSRMAKKGRRATNEERVWVVQLLEDGYSAEAVADMLGVARSSVFSWQKKYREEVTLGTPTLPERESGRGKQHGGKARNAAKVSNAVPCESRVIR